MSASPSTAGSGKWLVRIPEVFTDFSAEILAGLDALPLKNLGDEYRLIELTDPQNLRSAPEAGFVRWNLPVEHSWPSNPEKMPSFVEKSAQALFAKFGVRHPQAVLMGVIDPSAKNRYYRMLSSNLRGRTLQLFPKEVAQFSDVEAQDPARETLFCLVGKEGLFAGMSTPRLANGFHAGGTRYIRQTGEDTISRAGAKIAEALHYLPLHRPLPEPGSHWLELGASPGGMTSELLAREYQVTAIDRAVLDPRLNSQRGLRFIRQDVALYQPGSGAKFDAILSDMNGDPLDALRQVVRLSAHLKPGGLVIFTLKTAGAATFDLMRNLHREAMSIVTSARLRPIATTHLTYNRHELTLVLEKPVTK